MFSLPKHSNLLYNTLTALNENIVTSIFKRCSSNKHQSINSTMLKTKTMIGGAVMSKMIKYVVNATLYINLLPLSLYVLYLERLCTSCAIQSNTLQIKFVNIKKLA